MLKIHFFLTFPFKQAIRYHKTKAENVRCAYSKYCVKKRHKASKHKQHTYN